MMFHTISHLQSLQHRQCNGFLTRVCTFICGWQRRQGGKRLCTKNISSAKFALATNICQKNVNIAHTSASSLLSQLLTETIKALLALHFLVKHMAKLSSVTEALPLKSFSEATEMQDL